MLLTKNFTSLYGYGAKWLSRPAILAVTCTAWIAISVIGSLSGCNSQPQHPAAPLGNEAALEMLATSYNKLSEVLPTSPVKLRPKARLKFVKQVFADAGYDYTLTLVALANTNPDEATQHHKDMKELLYLPHYGVKFEDIRDIYSNKELSAIRKIDEHIK